MYEYNVLLCKYYFLFIYTVAQRKCIIVYDTDMCIALRVLFYTLVFIFIFRRFIAFICAQLIDFVSELHHSECDRFMDC